MGGVNGWVRWVGTVGAMVNFSTLICKCANILNITHRNSSLILLVFLTLPLPLPSPLTQLSVKNAALEEELKSYQEYMKSTVLQYKKKIAGLKSQLLTYASSASALTSPHGEEYVIYIYVYIYMYMYIHVYTNIYMYIHV